ncbi:hypothetical protein [Enterovibrio nigricans]|uniref:Uncharacterized protein n=1 Tax=Enterovibrio nigricans DSM 22720 TaxID=1121868 RepID=A0A1T4V523_9GAMM|nr:hypothetical protein [Enterovibrio nigricans]PKF50388.1 hypothetical protein AT251_11760 [Enterovibrio nigricans]SKA60059.1 hypothetical protein SAMN02745132_03226 [Enterovibrio nigricans DSM 22720]
MTTFTLGRKTLVNRNSLEYEWVRLLVNEGNTESGVIGTIQRCFGGDIETASLFFKVAMGETSPGFLLTHLSLSDWASSHIQARVPETTD